MARIALFGATSAIAAASARRWAARGDDLFLVGRSPDKLAALAAELPSSRVKGVHSMDFAAPESMADDAAALKAVVAEAIEALGGLDIALIAHGVLSDQLDTEARFSAAELCFRVNLLSVVGLLMPLADHCEQMGAGRLAVITSVAAERGRPRNFTYGAAKAALNTYLEGLRTRLYPTGATVHTLKVGPTDSPMTTEHDKHPLFAQPDQVAQGIVSALDRGTPVAYVPGYWKPFMGIIKRLPEPVFQRFDFLAGR